MTQPNSLSPNSPRTTPNKVINPRLTVDRMPEGNYILNIFIQQGEVVKAQHFQLSRAAGHELFDELVGALSKEEF